MTLPLLTTKLHTPAVRPGVVSRPRLVERLNAGLPRKLTLVSAPAGFGKTTLVAAWLSGVDRPCTWISLDEEDNDPARFLAYLVAALQKVDPAVGRATQAMLQSPQPPPSQVLLTALINDLAAVARPFVLVFDDYHAIHALPIHEQLAFLLEHQPAHVHVVIASREDPPLPLPRLRARAQMAELRQADLQFTEQEAADFFRRTAGLALPAASVTMLHQRTEGWIAGMQLAALSIQRSQDVDELVRSFANSHRYVLDYLIEEVFRQQPGEIQEFLLKTSILDRLSAALCEAVTGHDGGSEMLRSLEQANLFVFPLDESREWYRYHHLFADLLRRQAHTQLGELVPLLHQRASRWYEGAGLLGDAVHHALAGCDWPRAVDLILAASDALMKRGELVTLLRWHRALPEPEILSRPHLCLEYGWVLILTGQLDDAESYLGQAAENARDVPPLLGAILAAQGHRARVRGQDRRAIELSSRALALLPEGDHNGRSVAAVNLGIAEWNCGHLADAERALQEAERAARQSGNHYARLVALGFLGTIQATWGKLRQAADLYEQAIRSGQRLPPVALACNELGELLYEWDRLGEGIELVERSVEMSRRSGNAEIASGGYRTLARLKQAQGDEAAALEVVAQVESLAGDDSLSPLLRARLAAGQAARALNQGDLTAALRWGERVTVDADGSPFYPLLNLTPARLLLAQGRQEEATRSLAACAEIAAREGWQYGLVAVRALQSLAANAPGEALARLSEALALAEPEGYVRTFVDLGAPMETLLAAFCDHPTADPALRAYAARLRAAFSPAVVPAPLPTAPAPAQPASALVEPLSDRELDVLRLLVDRQSNQEIAHALCVSVNTVKTHLNSIYGKLGVHSRRQAAAQAEKLGLC